MSWLSKIYLSQSRQASAINRKPFIHCVYQSVDARFFFFLSFSSLYLTFHHIAVINHVEIKWNYQKKNKRLNSYTINVYKMRLIPLHISKYKYREKWFITIIKTKINYIFDEHEAHVHNLLHMWMDWCAKICRQIKCYARQMSFYHLLWNVVKYTVHTPYVHVYYAWYTRTHSHIQ